MRHLKHHEKKLLKKVDFLQWKQDVNLREVKVMRRYHIQQREDYHSYNQLCGQIRHISHRLSKLPIKDPFRISTETQLIDKLYDLGILNDSSTNTQQEEGGKMNEIESNVTVSSFCRRRLAVVVCRIKMAESIKMATQYIEQGQIRVGPEVITDPSYLVTRNTEDFITWVQTSKLKRHIQTYANQLDDYDLL